MTAIGVWLCTANINGGRNNEGHKFAYNWRAFYLQQYKHVVVKLDTRWHKKTNNNCPHSILINLIFSEVSSGSCIFNNNKQKSEIESVKTEIYYINCTMFSFVPTTLAPPNHNYGIAHAEHFIVLTCRSISGLQLLLFTAEIVNN